MCICWCTLCNEMHNVAQYKRTRWKLDSIKVCFAKPYEAEYLSVYTQTLFTGWSSLFMEETQTLFQSLQDAYRNVVLVQIFSYDVRVSVYPSEEKNLFPAYWP